VRLAVQFAGNPKLRTRYRSAKGEGNLTVLWAEQLWLPVTVPTMTNTIQIAVRGSTGWRRC
jgi:hypothetical protein